MSPRTYRDRVNVDAFGPTGVRQGHGVDPFYGGTPGDYPGIPGTARSPNGFQLGDAAADAAAAAPITITPSLPAIAAGYGAMAAGGALTGYLASGGTSDGTGTGALVHCALFSFGTALAGRGRFTTPWLLAFAAIGLGTASGAVYLFRRNRRSWRTRR